MAHHRHHIRVLFAIVILSATLSFAQTQPTTSTSQPADSAIEAVRQFRNALKDGDMKRAREMIAPMTEMPNQEMINRELEEDLQRFMDSFSSGQSDFEVLDAKESGDFAVVIVKENLKRGNRAFDIDPLYLIRRDGQWKLLAELTEYNQPIHGLNATQLDEYKILEKWFEVREEKLRE